jgi:hypothetical protein
MYSSFPNRNPFSRPVASSSDGTDRGARPSGSPPGRAPGAAPRLHPSLAPNHWDTMPSAPMQDGPCPQADGVP